MKASFRAIEDHEEFLNLVQGSESGIYAKEMWQIHSHRRDRPVSSPNIARRAFKALYERERWDTGLLNVKPGISLQPLAEGVAAGGPRRRSNPVDLSLAGFWWATAPVGYWEDFDHPEAHAFRVRTGGLDVSLWAFERNSRLAPDRVPSLPEFEYRWEAALVDRVIVVYDDGPEAPFVAGR